MIHVNFETPAHNDLSIEQLATLIRYAQELLGLPSESIIIRFSDKPYCILEYHENEHTRNAIEIRFDAERAELMCNLDENRKCESIIISPDKLASPGEHTRYLNSTYMHDYATCHWSLPGGTLLLGTDRRNGEYYFILNSGDDADRR